MLPCRPWKGSGGRERGRRSAANVHKREEALLFHGHRCARKITPLSFKKNGLGFQRGAEGSHEVQSNLDVPRPKLPLLPSD